MSCRQEAGGERGGNLFSHPSWSYFSIPEGHHGGEKILIHTFLLGVDDNWGPGTDYSRQINFHSHDFFFNVIYSDEFGYCNHLNFNLIDCKLPNEAKIFFGLLFDSFGNLTRNCRKYIRFHFWTTSDITIAD